MHEINFAIWFTQPTNNLGNIDKYIIIENNPCNWQKQNKTKQNKKKKKTKKKQKKKQKKKKKQIRTERLLFV